MVGANAQQADNAKETRATPHARIIRGATAANAPVAHNHKAGIVLVGDVTGPDGTKCLHVVAPWTEGSFTTDGKKAYMLAKGKIDPNEKRMDAAIREMGEETGIYLDKIPSDGREVLQRLYIFNPANKRHQKWKAQGRDCFYEGVEIEEIWKKPVLDGMIPSNRGNPAHHTIYLVKVKGIERLAEHLKHRENNIEGDSVKHKAFDLAVQRISEHKLPAFVHLLQTLRSGRWQWGDEATHGVLFDASIVAFEKDYLRKKHGRPVTDAQGWGYYEIDPRIAADIESGRLTISTPQEFDDFYQNYAVEHNVQDTIKDRVKKIRQYMEQIGLVNDCSSLKVDTKNTPLRYYQEGADIIPYEVWLDRAIEVAQQPESRVYREAQFNQLITDRKPGQAYVGLGQSIGGAMLEIGKLLDVHEGNRHPFVGHGKPQPQNSVVFSTAQGIFNEMGRVVHSAPLQEQAVRRLHDQVCADRRARGYV